MTFEILVVAKTCVSVYYFTAGYRITGGIQNYTGTTQLQYSNVETLWEDTETCWDVRVTADNVNDALKVEVMGRGFPFPQTIRWVAAMRAVELRCP